MKSATKVIVDLVSGIGDFALALQQVLPNVAVPMLALVKEFKTRHDNGFRSIVA